FGIRHRGSTVPERSGVALSFCRRLDIIDRERVIAKECICNGSCVSQFLLFGRKQFHRRGLFSSGHLQGCRPGRI
ncbi:hypothetical protein FA460_17650, partial [Pseudomonas aeruginosa]|nr:hypothetical protein [Pseudomonas aeruginosa]MCO1720199.1 hypothetical protein [Pseudomonas aeruginosa]